METLFFLVIAVSLAYAVGCWGRTRKIGFGLAFVLALVNLLVGIIAVAWRNRSIPTQFRTSESTHSVMKMTMEWP